MIFHVLNYLLSFGSWVWANLSFHVRGCWDVSMRKTWVTSWTDPFRLRGELLCRFSFVECVFHQIEFPFSCVVKLTKFFLPLPLISLDSPSSMLSFSLKLMDSWAGTNFMRPSTRIIYYYLLEDVPLFGQYSGGTCSYASYITGCWDLKP